MNPIQLPLGVTLSDVFTFNNYLGGRNHLVIESLHEVLGQSQFRCVYLSGLAGTGKTHLLQAACHLKSEQGSPSSFVPLRQFGDAAPEVLQGLENMDLVCIDDLERVAGSEPWELALFNLYNRMRETGHTLIVTSVSPPDQAGIVLPDLLSRLKWDLVLALKPLDDEQLLQALQLRCQNRGIELPPDTASYLLRRLDRSMDGLYQSVDTVINEAIAQQRRLTIPFVKQCYPEL